MTYLRSALALSASLLAVGCATIGPDYDAPDTTQFTEDLFVDDRGNAREPAHDWWTGYADPALDDLVAVAFEANRDLAIASANVRAARALLRFETTNRRPTGEVTATAQRRQLSGAAFGLGGAAFDDTPYYEAGLAASWELDFFGRVRRLTEAARADEAEAEWLRRDAAVLVAAEVTTAYAAFRGSEAQIAVAERNAALQAQTLDLTRIRLEGGLGSQLEVSLAATQLRTTQAGIPSLRAEREAARNRLATLTGLSAERLAAALAPKGQLVPPAGLDVGDAEGLLRRRADVRAAERTLAAETARIGIAKADYFPRISLIGSVSGAATAISDLDGSAALGFGIGPSLTWSGFDVPRVGARVEGQRAQADAALAAYERAVLRALEDARTSVPRYAEERAREAALSQAARQARIAAVTARQR